MGGCCRFTLCPYASKIRCKYQVLHGECSHPHLLVASLFARPTVAGTQVSAFRGWCVSSSFTCVHRRPAPDWPLCVFHTPFLAGGGVSVRRRVLWCIDAGCVVRALVVRSRIEDISATDGKALVAYFWIIIGFAAAILCFQAAYRFLYLRPHGTSIVMRSLPAEGGHGWRHGVIRYSDGVLDFFQLRSLSRKPDISLGRLDTQLIERRAPREDEAHTLESFLKVLVVSSGGHEYELAMDLRGETAFTAWLESAPTQRLERSDAATALRKVERYHRRHKSNN